MIENQIIKDNKKLLKRFYLSISGVLKTLFVSLFGLLINFILLHYKDPSILDTYVFCIATVNLFFMFSNWGGKEYLIVTLSKNQSRLHEKSADIINNRIIFSLISGCLIVFLSIEIEIKIFIILFVLLKTLSAFFDSLTTILKNFHQIILFDVLLYGLFTFFVYYDGNTSNIIVFLFELLVLEILRLLFYMYIYRKYYSLKLSIKLAFDVAKQSIPFFLLTVSGFLSSKADLYVVGIMLNKSEMSIYFIILNLISFCQVAYASFINTYSSNIYRLSNYSFRKFSNYTIYISSAISIFSAFLIYIICNLYYKIDFDILFSVLVAINMFIFNFVMIEVFNFNKRNKQKHLPKIFFITGLLNLLLSYAFIPSYGTIGAFFSSTLSALFSLFFLRYSIKSTKA